MFDRIAAATKEMAIHAAGGPAWPAHILGNFHKIYVLFRESLLRWRFLVSLGGVMTDQTVDSWSCR